MKRILITFNGNLAARWRTPDTLRAVMRENHRDGYATAWRYYYLPDA